MRKKRKSLLDYFWEIKDKRNTRKKYSLKLILTLLLLWVMWWRQSERWICRFIEDNEKDLKKELKLKIKSLPKRSTIRDTLKQIEFNEVNNKFYLWAIQYVEIKKWEWLSSDGKAIRWTLEWENNSSFQNFLSLVSLYLVRSKQVIWAWKIETKKESEIPKVKELVNLLWSKWVIITLDALHCQRETVKTIVESWNDYVIWVKWNQPNLKKLLKKTLKNEKI